MRAILQIGLLGLLAGVTLMLALLGASARMVANNINNNCLVHLGAAGSDDARVTAYLRCTFEGIEGMVYDYPTVWRAVEDFERQVARQRTHYENTCAPAGEAERFRADSLRTADNLRAQADEPAAVMRMVHNQRSQDVHNAWLRRQLGGNLNDHLRKVAAVNNADRPRLDTLMKWPRMAERAKQSLQAMRPRQCAGPSTVTHGHWFVWLKQGEYTCCRAPDGRMPQPARWDLRERIPAGSKVIGGPFADERAARAWMCGHQVNIAQAHIHNWAIVNGTLVSNLPCANLANTRYK